MDTRSTNYGFASPKNIISNVNSSHGVMLSGGSTGGVVEAIGDDADVTLTLRGKGAGGLVLGSTAQGLTFNSTTARIGSGSTTDITMIQRYRIDWTIPALSSAGAAGASADSTVTVTGLTTASVLLFGQTQVWNSTTDPGLIVTVRCSTANELKITTHNLGASTLSGSTKSGMLVQFAF